MLGLSAWLINDWVVSAGIKGREEKCFQAHYPPLGNINTWSFFIEYVWKLLIG